MKRWVLFENATGFFVRDNFRKLWYFYPKISVNSTLCNRKVHFLNNESLSPERVNHFPLDRGFVRQTQHFYLLDVAANAFRNRPHGRESSQNGILELLAVDQADRDDSAYPIDLASAALNNTSSASDQNAHAYALPKNNKGGDEQPPPDRSLSDVQRGEASSRTEPAKEGIQLNLSGVAKAFLFISSEVGLASSAIRFTSSKPLSANASFLFSLAELFSVAVFSLCLGGYTLQHRRRGELAARLLTVAGSIVTACGFLSLMSTNFLESIMLWLTGAIYMIPISILPFMFK